MLGTIPSRPATYIGKILLLIIGAIGAVVLALGAFLRLYIKRAPFALYLKAGTLLILTSLPLYLIHLFVGLNFGKGASMGAWHCRQLDCSTYDNWIRRCCVEI